MRRLHSIVAGILFSAIGILVSGSTTSGYFCLLGILTFSVGEMLSSPKMYDYLGVIAPSGEKGLYMGYANIPIAIGWAVGSLLGGNLYEAMGDKANLALRYFSEYLNITDGIARTEAVAKLQDALSIDAVQVTKLLWDTYNPNTLWYLFSAIGFATAVGMFFYGRAARKWEPREI